jgi:arylsulfatase A-like enzyme
MSMFSRKEFLLGASGLAAASALSSRAIGAKPRKRPNILFVLADEWRAQALRHMGDGNVRTPALDRFHREAISLNQALAGTPVCCPSRASLMTGNYALTNGVYINDVPLKPTNTTLAEAFGNAGYKTGYIGKWHLHGSPEGRYERRLAYIPPDKRFGFDYWKACECTHDYNHSLYYEGNDPTPRYWDGYDAIAQTDDAIRFVQDHAGKPDPYFLVLAWGPPHFPYSAPEAYTQLYAGTDIALRPNVPPADKEKALNELRGYYAAIAALDDCFARLMSTVEKLDPEDTIVVFTSDHGEMAYSQGLPYKIYPWEESVRIPFMVRYPRKLGRTQRDVPALLNSPDIMPTLLGLADVPVPAGLQGHDHSPALLGEGDRRAPDTAFLSMPVPITTARTFGIDAYRGVRDSRYTYVRTRQGPWLLYDNKADPYQMRNLVGSSALRADQARLERSLDAWLERLDDRFLAPEDYLRRDHLMHFFEALMPVGHVDSAWGDWHSNLAIPTDQGRSIDTALRDLLAVPQTAAIVDAVAPRLRGGLARSGAHSPRAISVLAPALITQGELAELDQRLKAR